MELLTLNGLVTGRLRDMHQSKQELARCIGVPVETLNRRLDGTSPLRASDATAIAKFTGLTVDEVCQLAPGTGE